MREDSGSHGYECTGGKAVEHAEDDYWCVAAGGEPESEDYDGGEESGCYHCVEAADSVGHYSGEDTAENTGWLLVFAFESWI